jgi:hypothetical protein
MDNEQFFRETEDSILRNLLSMDIDPVSRWKPREIPGEDIPFRCWFIDAVKEEEHEFAIEGKTREDAFSTILKEDAVKEWFLGLKLVLEGEDDADTNRDQINRVYDAHLGSITMDDLKKTLDEIATTSTEKTNYGPFHLMIEKHWETCMPCCPQTKYYGSWNPIRRVPIAGLPVLSAEDDVEMD